MMTTKNWEYETKCRRCGNLKIWDYGEKKHIEKQVFAPEMWDYLNKPPLLKCDKCDKYTIQDLVAYTDPFHG